PISVMFPLSLHDALPIYVHTDVVSGGELYTALKAGFPAEKISFHGNNKSEEELEMAVDNHVGVIILDNFYEIDLLEKILETKDRSEEHTSELQSRFDLVC